MKYQAFQGDVLIESVDEIPAGLEQRPLDAHGRAVIAYGEATGHLHAFHGPQIVHFMADGVGRVQYIDAPRGGKLAHETGPGMLTTDHDVLPKRGETLPPGKYRFIRQTEAPWNEVPRIVQD